MTRKAKQPPRKSKAVSSAPRVDWSDEDGNVTTRALPTCPVTPGLEVSVHRHKLQEAVDSGFTTWTLSGGMNPLCSRDGDNTHGRPPKPSLCGARIPAPRLPNGPWPSPHKATLGKGQHVLAFFIYDPQYILPLSPTPAKII